MMVSFVDEHNLEEEKKLLRRVFKQETRGEAAFWIYHYDQDYYKVLSACAKLRLKTKNLPEGNPNYIEVKDSDWQATLGAAPAEDSGPAEAPAPSEAGSNDLSYQAPEPAAPAVDLSPRPEDKPQAYTPEPTRPPEPTESTPALHDVLEDKYQSEAFNLPRTGESAHIPPIPAEPAAPTATETPEAPAPTRSEPRTLLRPLKLEEKRDRAQQAQVDSLKSREEALLTREEAVRAREDSIRKREAALVQSEEELVLSSQALEREESELTARQAALQSMQNDLDSMASLLRDQKNQIRSLANHLHRVSTDLMAEDV